MLNILTFSYSVLIISYITLSTFVLMAISLALQEFSDYWKHLLRMLSLTCVFLANAWQIPKVYGLFEPPNEIVILFSDEMCNTCMLNILGKIALTAILLIDIAYSPNSIFIIGTFIFEGVFQFSGLWWVFLS